MNFFKHILILSFLLIGVNCFTQDYCMVSPVGFGQNTTGGGNGTVQLVTTHAELKSALKASGSAVIIATKDIYFGENEMISEAISNKTLLGLKGVKLISTARTARGGILGLKDGSNNVIIRNLIFEGPGAFDVDGRDLLQNTGCTNLWVDHCEFYDGVDGNFDNTNRADNITISWCKFGYIYPSKIEGMTGDGSGEHRYSNLVGGSSGDYPNDGFYSITFQYCYWGDGCAQRMPRARNAELHVLNCYYNTNVSGSLAIGLGAGSKGTTCYVEGANFKKVGNVVNTGYDEVAGKSVAVNFVDCLKGGVNSGTVSKPSYNYSVLDVNQLESVITSSCGAGATLDVALTGEISSACASQAPLMIPDNVNAITENESLIIAWDAVEDATGYRIKLCSQNANTENTASLTEWDFTSAWTINADNADANLVLDESNPFRFNYKPATSSEELKFASGTKIPDVEGLKFTAGSDTRLRLGFDSGLVYLNGSGISIEIPCSIGDYVTVTGTSANATATDRGFSVNGASIDASGTSGNIVNGIIAEAGATGTWSYVATENYVKITTINGGMNISKIVVTSVPLSFTICNEFDVDAAETSKTIDGLANNEYTYQVKALRDEMESNYSDAQKIIVQNSTSIKGVATGNDLVVMQNSAQLIVFGADVQELRLYNQAGSEVAVVYGTQIVDISAVPQGFYILVVKTNDGIVVAKKIIK